MGIPGPRKQLDWQGMSSLLFRNDLNMTETETTTCPSSASPRPGCLLMTFLRPFELPSDSCTLSVDFCNNLLKKSLNMFATHFSLSLFSSPAFVLPQAIFSSAPARQQLFMAFIFASGDKMLCEIHAILCDNIQ